MTIYCCQCAAEAQGQRTLEVALEVVALLDTANNC